MRRRQSGLFSGCGSGWFDLGRWLLETEFEKYNMRMTSNQENKIEQELALFFNCGTPVVKRLPTPPMGTPIFFNLLPVPESSSLLASNNQKHWEHSRRIQRKAKEEGMKNEPSMTSAKLDGIIPCLPLSSAFHHPSDSSEMTTTISPTRRESSSASLAV